MTYADIITGLIGLLAIVVSVVPYYKADRAAKKANDIQAEMLVLNKRVVDTSEADRDVRIEAERVLAEAKSNWLGYINYHQALVDRHHLREPATIKAAHMRGRLLDGIPIMHAAPRAEVNVVLSHMPGVVTSRITSEGYSISLRYKPDTYELE